MKAINYVNKKYNEIKNRIGEILYEKDRVLTLRNEECTGTLDEYYSNRQANCFINTPEREQIDDNIELSIIVPLYNASRYIERCVNGLLLQKTEYKYEIILINDGSTDDTKEQIEEIRRKKPEIIRAFCQKNNGISSARNKGMSLARGKYFAFVDQDDRVTDNFVQLLIENAIKYDADIVKSAYCDIKTYGRKRINEASLCVVNSGMTRELFDYKSYVYPGIFRRELFDHIEFPEGFWYEDMIIRTLIYRQAKVFVHIPDVLYYKMFHNSNASLTVWDVNNIKALDHLYLSLDIISSSDKLKLPRDVWMYQCLMREYTTIFAMRIRRLDENIKQLAFLKACDVLEELYCDDFFEKMLQENKIWQRIFENREYKLWLLKCGYYYQ